MSVEQKKDLDTLTEFIERNSKLFTTLGVCVTLSVLANNLTDRVTQNLDKGICKFLSFVLFSLSLFVFLEIVKNFKDFEYYGKLYWFREVFSLAMAVFAYIWVRIYYPYLFGLLVILFYAALALAVFAFAQVAIRATVLRIPWLRRWNKGRKDVIALVISMLLIVAGVLSLHLLRR